MNTVGRYRQRILGLSAVISVAVLLAACTGPVPGDSNGAGDPVTGGTLTYAIASEPTAWDIHSNGADIVAALQRNVFDSLVSQSSDGEFHPWLAESWEISDDGKSYTFFLRDDVTFHDGAAFNAEAVKANFDHVVDPNTKSQYAAGLLGPYTGTEVLDEYTVKLSLERPFAAIMQSLSTAYLGFYSPASLETPDQLNTANAAIGTGPFKVGTLMAGQNIEYVVNEEYDWAPEDATHEGRAYLDSLIVQFIPEDSARVGALTSGQVSVAGGIPPSEVAGLEADDQLTIMRTDQPGLPYTMFLNNSRPPLDDVNVRRALQLALPLDQIVDTIYFGEYKRAWGPLTPSSVAYDASVEGTTEFDVDAAATLLDEAGWEVGPTGIREKDGASLSLEWPVAQAQREQRDVVAQSLKASLEDVGIELLITPLDTGTYINRLIDVDYDVIDWSFVRSDPDILRLHLHSANIPIQNASAVNEPQLDKMLEAGNATIDPSERAAIYSDVQHLVIDQAMMIPIYVPGFTIGVQQTVGGVEYDINAFPRFYGAWVADQ